MAIRINILIIITFTDTWYVVLLQLLSYEPVVRTWYVQTRDALPQVQQQTNLLDLAYFGGHPRYILPPLSSSQPVIAEF